MKKCLATLLSLVLTGYGLASVLTMMALAVSRGHALGSYIPQNAADAIAITFIACGGLAIVIWGEGQIAPKRTRATAGDRH